MIIKCKSLFKFSQMFNKHVSAKPKMWINSSSSKSLLCESQYSFNEQKQYFVCISPTINTCSVVSVPIFCHLSDHNVDFWRLCRCIYSVLSLAVYLRT